MLIRSEHLRPGEGYKLLSGTVVPRPVAFVTTVDPNGVVNAAPFSFFNAVSGTPPIVMVSIGEREAGVPKDSAANIYAGGEFVVNIVDEALSEKMNLAATPFPQGVSEVETLGLRTKPGVVIGVPRLADSPVSLECRARERLELYGNHIFFGEVVCFHLRDDLYDEGRIDPVKLNAIGRLAGSTYCTTHELFYHKRLTYEQWLARYGADSK